MSRILSALRRIPDNGFAQDICAGVVMCAFILAAGFLLAEASQVVAAARALP